MASSGDYEDGEILEEGEEIAQPSSSLQPDVSATSLYCASVDACISAQPFVQPPNEPLLPTPGSNPRKRLHSSLQDARGADLNSVYDRRIPLCHRQPLCYSHNSNNGYNDRRRDTTPQDDRVYAEDLIVQYPSQQPRSNVLLDFGTWMAAAGSKKRLNVEDVQTLVLNVLRGGSRKEKGVVSPYLLPSLMPGEDLPTKVCLILLNKMRPLMLQQYRAKLSFFNECSSVPVVLTKQQLNQIRRSEAPLPELMYKFPRPTVNTHELSIDELFYAHELTFLMKHSLGFTDELMLSPTGTFIRKSRPLGGTWALDGDLLHLKWRQRTTKVAPGADETATDLDTVMEEENAVAYTLDVLVSQDASMHEFRTDPVTDETYAHKVPEHLAKKHHGDDKPRSIWLSLAKAIAVDVPRSADGTLILRDQAQTNGLSKYQHDPSSADANGHDAKKERS
ncbi:unnamed protein product [Peronospora destructor]|uniref:Uncharacterized protein n=1 Tax=Peronospora destructor TaxID=86335 RepID=A0AAV0V9Y9_9STRA|nr:unnamed protein product [Peronospora destructor]